MKPHHPAKQINWPARGLLAVLVGAAGIEAYRTWINPPKTPEQVISEVMDGILATMRQPKPAIFTEDEWDEILHFEWMWDTFVAEAHIAFINAMERYTIRNPRPAGMSLAEYREIREQAAYEEVYGPNGKFNPKDGSRR